MADELPLGKQNIDFREDRGYNGGKELFERATEFPQVAGNYNLQRSKERFAREVEAEVLGQC